jgi:tetraacyldisaccharide-1-P 4'-kinase
LYHAPVLETALRLVMPRTRPVRVPPGIRTVTVGGATLGGSGKTRVAIAIAKALASRGERVVLVGHAYRAAPSFARFVSPNDRLEDVGDEAIVCARALEAMAGIAGVVVAPSRQDAVDHAAPHATVLVFDGPLQLRPRRASLAVLTVDETDAAPHRSLVRHVDHVVPVASTIHPADIRDLRDVRFGLFTAIARPRRIADALRREGLVPTITVETSDHGPVSASARRSLATAEVDLWVATPKCSVHLEGNPLSAPLHVLTCLDPPIPSALTLSRAHPIFPATFRDDKT